MAEKKRYRITLHYEVELGSLPGQALEPEEDKHRSPETLATAVSYERRLFEALVRNPARCDQWCRRAILDVVEIDLAVVLRCNGLHAPCEDSLFYETFAELPSADAAYWEKLASSDVFYENTESVRKMVQPCLIEVTMEAPLAATGNGSDIAENDFCPCGSRKGFKQCCGLANQN